MILNVATGLWLHGPMEFVEFGRLTPEYRAELEGDEEDPFDSAGSPIVYRAKERHVALKGDDGRLVASTGIVHADAEVDGTRFPVIGIGGVIVAERHRGNGLARRMVGAGLEMASAEPGDFALLFCHENRAGLYRKLGFARVEDEVVVGQPDGVAVMSMWTMWHPLRPGAQWPPGPVRIHGLPW